MMSANGELSLSQKLALLIAEGQPIHSDAVANMADIARLTGISQQTLLNMLNGQSTNPRLDTLRGFCHLYGISLDYFDCVSEDECRAHLLQQATTRHDSLFHEILNRTQNLNIAGKKRVLNLMLWMQLGMRAELAQQQRKSH